MVGHLLPLSQTTQRAMTDTLQPVLSRPLDGWTMGAAAQGCRDAVVVDFLSLSEGKPHDRLINDPEELQDQESELQPQL